MKASALVMATFVFSAPLRAGVVFEKQLIEVHAKPADTETKVAFPFRVTSEHPLRILTVKSSCECTEGKPNKDYFLPDESGEFHVVFKHGDRVGLQAKSIVIQTDEPDTPAQKLDLKIHIPTLLEVAPIALFWKRGASREKKEISIIFPDQNALPVAVRVLPQSENLSLDLKTIEPRKRYVLAVAPNSTDSFSKDVVVVEADFGSEIGVKRRHCYAYVK